MISDADLKTAIDLYGQSGSMLNGLWSQYAVGALGLLGYILGAKQPVPGRAKVGLAVAFAVFAAVNAGALYRAQAINWEASTIITATGYGNQSAAALAPVFREMAAISPTTALALQGLFSVAALAAIYWAHRHDSARRGARAEVEMV